MAAINVTNLVMKAFYEMLNGHVNVGTAIPVYRVNAPITEEGHYILLRVESETYRSNNSKFVSYPVIITEVVTRFAIAIKDGVAADIDNEIVALLYPSIGQLGLPLQNDIQITSVERVNATYIPEDDGATNKIHTLSTRNVCRVVQLQEVS